MWFVKFVLGIMCATTFFGCLKVAIKSLFYDEVESGVGILAVMIMIITGIAFGSLLE